MSALLSFPSTSTSFWRSPRSFVATTIYSVAISSMNTMQSRTTIATRATLTCRSDFPLPPHSLPKKHSSGFPASTLSGSFTKNGMSGTRPHHEILQAGEILEVSAENVVRYVPAIMFICFWHFFCFVRVLGTFITKWDEGKAVCDTLLSTKKTTHMYAERLAELAVDLGFDGWLFIVDNAFFYAWIISDMSAIFVLMWIAPKVDFDVYDSVTLDGKLNWQDQVNEHNKPFFDICDGIFVNYTWKEDYPRLSVAVAGDWKFDVYMGIDVFGNKF
ncbi:Cytosolic endo-beta-N-acetylglucosaminidase 2 [Glycine soja]